MFRGIKTTIFSTEINMKNIKTLIFDLGNVIIPLEDEKYWWNETFLGIFENYQEVQQLKEDQFFVRYEKGEILTNEFLEKLSQFLKPEFQEKDIILRWNALLKEIPERRLDFLKELKNKYSIYLLSNTNEIHLDFIISALKEKYGLDTLEEIFNHCYYSFQIKEVKPDAAIFLKVLNEQNLVAEECLFIDDKIENLYPAEKLGIQTILHLPHQEIHIELKDFLN